VPSPGFFFLLVVSSVALLSHLALDWTNTYGVRPFLPFSDERVYGDLFFIADPWLWIILGGALALQAKRGRGPSLLWGSLFLACLAIILTSTRDPSWLAPAFIGAIVVLAFLRGIGFLSGKPRAARGAIALVVAYAFAVAFLREEATARLAPPSPAFGPVLDVARIPQPADPTEWGVVVASEEELRYGAANAFENRREWTEIERRLLDPRVARALETPSGRAIRHFARFLCAEVEPREGGRAEVFLRDARYVLAPQRAGFGVRAITVEDGGAAASPPAR
jgi:inner membrane protein